MRRTATIVALTAGGLIVLVVVLIGLVVAAANADWGRHLIEAASARWSGNRIIVTGLSGRFPDDLRIAHIEISDENGPWIVADDLALRWSPSQLSRKNLRVQLLRADRVQLLRRPPPWAGSGTESHQLPGRIDVDRVEVDRLDVGAPIAGAEASLSVRGELHAASLTDGETRVSVRRIDGPGTYELAGRIDASLLKAELALDEPAHGLLSGLAGLPDLGPLSIRLSVDGPRQAEATRFTLSAGALRAEGRGLVDLVGRTVDVDVSARAPAMAPRPDVSWQSLELQAHVHGPFTGPDASGQLRIDALKAGEGQLRSVRAEVEGNRGAVSLRAVLDRLRVPGPRPALFESSPVELRADLRLDDPARPMTFAVSHPLLSLQGRANTAGELSGEAKVNAPSLAP
ncbi:MAG TPA: hypothetical protein VFF44_10025, partial [Casimicrobiaceae bacterium]|nr:hypothetical protein [Casimicrobiaceae bacterium]